LSVAAKGERVSEAAETDRDWRRVCALDELPAPGVRTLTLSDLSVAVFRLADGRLCAIEDRCPHRGARLSAGVVYDGDKVACMDHGWGIRLSDGGVEAPESGCVRTFAVKVEDGAVFVQIQTD
jgi:nitrite reductase (NADH) small subunit